jgi:hypothetical protein
MGCKPLPNGVRGCTGGGGGGGGGGQPSPLPTPTPTPSPPPCRIVDGREGTCVKFGACKRQWEWLSHFNGEPLSTCGANAALGCCTKEQPPAQVCTASADPPGVFRTGMCVKSCGSNKDGKSSDECVGRKCCVDKAKQCKNYRCYEPFAKIDQKKKRTRCRGITSCEDAECGCKPVLPLCKSFRGCDVATEYVTDPKKECFDPAACIASECCEPKASCTDAASYALCQANPLSYAKNAADVQPFCKNSKFCGESECCALRGVCGDYECTSLKQTGATPRAAKDTRCHASTCTDYECNCENPVITCAMPLHSKGPFQCPANTHVTSSALNGGGACADPKCSVNECCQPRDECRTSSVECARAQVRRQGASLCTGARCRRNECCDDLPMCANYICPPATHFDDVDKDTTVCAASASGKCMAKECCRERDVCNRSLCSGGDVTWEPRNSQRKLCGEQCSVENCCRKKQVCPAGRAAGKGKKLCPTGWQLKANSGSIECEANTCSNEVCCEPQPRCDGTVGALCDVNAGRALVQSPQLPPCAGVDGAAHGGCTAKHCCGDVQHCGTFDCSFLGLAHARILANCKTKWLLEHPDDRGGNTAASLPWEIDPATSVCTTAMCCYIESTIVKGTDAKKRGDDPGDNNNGNPDDNSLATIILVVLLTALVIMLCVGGAIYLYRRNKTISFGGGGSSVYELHTSAPRRADAGFSVHDVRRVVVGGDGGFHGVLKKKKKKKRTNEQRGVTVVPGNKKSSSHKKKHSVSLQSDDGSTDGDFNLMSNCALSTGLATSSTKRAHASFAAAKAGDMPRMSCAQSQAASEFV